VYRGPLSDRQLCMARMSVRETSPRESISQHGSIMYALSSRRHTQFKNKQEKKRHEELDTARAPVAACDSRNRADKNCEGEIIYANNSEDR